MTPAQRTLFDRLGGGSYTPRTLATLIGCSVEEINAARRERRRFRQGLCRKMRNLRHAEDKSNKFLTALRRMPPPAECEARLGRPVMIVRIGM